MSTNKSFKAGQTVKCTSSGDNRHLTTGKQYAVSKDCETSFLHIIADSGESHSYYASRFELVSVFPVLTVGQRVVLVNGEKGVVVVNGSNGLAIKLSGHELSWVEIHFNATERYTKDYNVMEVFAAPAACQAFDYDAKGDLVWSSASYLRVKAAKDAVEAAKAVLAQAEAELAGIAE